MHADASQCHHCKSAIDVSLLYSLPTCGKCSRIAVLNELQLKQVVEPVVNWIKSLIDAGQLNQIRIGLGQLGTPGDETVTMGQTTLRAIDMRGEAEILVTPGQHPLTLSGTLAHEFGHVLLFMDPKTLDVHPNYPKQDLITEGACEVMRALWLESINDGEARFLRQLMEYNTDPTYGDGFRLMWQEYLRNESLAEFLNKVVVDPNAFDSVVATRASDNSTEWRSADGRAGAVEHSAHRPIISMSPAHSGQLTNPAASSTNTGTNKSRIRPQISMRSMNEN